MKWHRIIGFIVFIHVYCPGSYSQFNNRFNDISNQDVIQALQFSGVDIFKFPIDSLNRNYRLSIIVDEYVKNDSIILSDTLLSGRTQYRKFANDSTMVDAYVDNIRILTKVLNNSFDKVYLDVSNNIGGKSCELQIEKKYARKHYWVRFAKQSFAIGHKIPLLFFGSEWDDVINGKLVPRFCSRWELTPELNDPTIKFIPHYFIISYALLEIPELPKIFLKK